MNDEITWTRARSNEYSNPTVLSSTLPLSIVLFHVLLLGIVICERNHHVVLLLLPHSCLLQSLSPSIALIIILCIRNLLMMSRTLILSSQSKQKCSKVVEQIASSEPSMPACMCTHSPAFTYAAETNLVSTATINVLCM